MTEVKLASNSNGRIRDFIQADLRSGTYGLRRRANNCGYALDSVRARSTKKKNRLTPGDYLVFINTKRTQVVAMNHKGMVIRGVDLGRVCTYGEVISFMNSFDITLAASKDKASSRITAKELRKARSRRQTAAPATTITTTATTATSSSRKVSTNKKAAKNASGSRTSQ